MEWQKPNKKKIKANLKEVYVLKSQAEELIKQLKEQKEILVKERDGKLGTENPS